MEMHRRLIIEISAFEMTIFAIYDDNIAKKTKPLSKAENALRQMKHYILYYASILNLALKQFSNIIVRVGRLKYSLIIHSDR